MLDWSTQAIKTEKRRQHVYKQFHPDGNRIDSCADFVSFSVQENRFAIVLFFFWENQTNNARRRFCCYNNNNNHIYKKIRIEKENNRRGKKKEGGEEEEEKKKNNNNNSNNNLPLPEAFRVTPTRQFSSIQQHFPRYVIFFTTVANLVR